MSDARDQAIKALEDFVHAGGRAQDAVDAIINAVRAPESEHTRAVRQRGECPESPHGFHDKTANGLCRHCHELVP